MQSRASSSSITTTAFQHQQKTNQRSQSNQFQQQRLVSPNQFGPFRNNTVASQPHQESAPFYSGYASSGSVGAFASARGGGLESDNVLNDLPDLSHLSEEERKIIEAVLERQRVEEAKNNASLSSSR
jgi:hypothetical protein